MMSDGDPKGIVTMFVYRTAATSKYAGRLCVITGKTAIDETLEPMFEVTFNNGDRIAASAFELHPWYPIRP